MSRPKLPTGVQVKHGSYYRPVCMVVDGVKRYKWHKLCRVSAGLPALYAAVAAFEAGRHGNATKMPVRVTEWLQSVVIGLSASEQKEYVRAGGIISAAFAEFRAEQVQARHIQEFLNQWVKAGKLSMAKQYRGRLHLLFDWIIVQGDRPDNPVDAVHTKSPKSRSRYMTDTEFLAIRSKLMGGDHQARSGAMLQCYVDLLYLTGQRGKEIRLLRWTQIDGKAIHFTPSKTMHSTAVKVDIPITPAIARVLDRAKGLMRDKSRVCPYVIHTLSGAAYGAHGVNTAWRRARERAGILDLTLRDLRAKHATDAEKAGHSVQEISDGLAHADTGTTRIYLKQRATKKGVVSLSIPESD